MAKEEKIVIEPATVPYRHHIDVIAASMDAKAQEEKVALSKKLKPSK